MAKLPASEHIYVGDYYIFKRKGIHALVRITRRERIGRDWEFEIYFKEPFWYSKERTLGVGIKWKWFMREDFVRPAYKSEVLAGAMRKSKTMLAEEELVKNPPKPKKVVKAPKPKKKSTKRGPRTGPKSFPIHSRVRHQGQYYRVLRRGATNLTLQSISDPNAEPLTRCAPDTVTKAPERRRTFRTGGSGKVLVFEQDCDIVVAFESFPTAFIEFRKDHGNFDILLARMAECPQVEWSTPHEFCVKNAPPESFDTLTNALKLKYKWT